ncbi:SRPBCC domain-containing protein [Denitromonas halophila]|uniref:SRPBCC domain-containing protein n=2 Tax=Denitromonas halophila TaxID=1629404 RepID=A0A557R0B7_9RHOO|nr:SRPBCC domain-containing protein [Denitromonas halophila]
MRMDMRADSRRVAFALTHCVAAPRDRVWAALSDAGHLTQWWAPAGAQMRAASLSFHLGGRFLYVIERPNEPPRWGRWVYRDIIEPARLVFVGSLLDTKGGVTRHPRVPHWPRYVHHTLELADAPVGTELRLCSRPVHASDAEIRAFEDGHDRLRRDVLDAWVRLDAYLAGEIEIQTEKESHHAS